MLLPYFGLLAALIVAARGHCFFPNYWYGRSLHGHLSTHFPNFIWSFYGDPSTSVFRSHYLVTNVKCMEQYGPFYLLHEVDKGGYWCLKEQQLTYDVTLIRIKFYHNKNENDTSVPTMCTVCQCADESYGYISTYPDDELIGIGEPLKCLFPHVHRVLGHHYDSYNTSSNHTDEYGDEYYPGHYYGYHSHDDGNSTHGNETYGEYGNMTDANYTHSEYNSTSSLEYLVNNYLKSILSSTNYISYDYQSSDQEFSDVSIGNMTDDDIKSLIHQYVIRYLSSYDPYYNYPSTYP